MHRSFREGPDWPVRSRPSVDASCLLRRQPPFPMPGGSRWSSCPAGSASARSIAGPLVLPRFVVLASTAHGAEVRRRRQAEIEAMPSSAEMEGYLRTIVRTKFGARSRRPTRLGDTLGSQSCEPTATPSAVGSSFPPLRHASATRSSADHGVLRTVRRARIVV